MAYTLTLQEKIHEVDDIHSFIFTPDESVQWKAGQFARFTIEDFTGEGKAFRTFTIASAPSEEIIMITTRIMDPCSDFKKHLLDMEYGATITMDGPYGKMGIDHAEQPILMLAGGIGITPFRSLLLDMDNKLDTLPTVSLLYNNENGHFVYRNKLTDLDNTHKSVNVHYIIDRDTNMREISRFIQAYDNNGLYLISGSPGFVNAMEKILTEQGIQKESMKHDPFYGY